MTKRTQEPDVAVAASALMTESAQENGKVSIEDGLLQVLGHDIRNHVLAISRSMEALLNEAAGSVTAKQAEFLWATRECCDVILGITSDLVDMSHLESGELTLALEDFDLIEAIQSSIRQCRGAALEKGSRISFCSIHPSISVHADRTRIIRVLVNLLWNAIRFSPANSVIRVSCTRQGETGPVVYVEDEGPGIPIAHQGRVFEKYYRAKNGGSSTGSGSGLGLYFCHETILAHGGRIWLVSPTGGTDRGTRVSFTLPCSNRGYA